MKIELGLPDWADERGIYIFAGIEEVAKRTPDTGNKWVVKKNRCTQCGECCKRLNCEHLVAGAGGYECDLRQDRPFNCCIGDGGKGCAITWKPAK